MKKRIIVWLITFCMTMGCFSSAYAEESTDGAVSEFTEVSDAEAEMADAAFPNASSPMTAVPPRTSTTVSSSSFDQAELR